MNLLLSSIYIHFKHSLNKIVKWMLRSLIYFCTACMKKN